jgi:hypothetical protein
LDKKGLKKHKGATETNVNDLTSEADPILVVHPNYIPSE